MNFQKINREEYRKLLSEVKFKTFFHEIEWHEFLEKQFRWLRFEYYNYNNEAILPLARFKVLGREKLVSLPFCEYGGPLFITDNLDLEAFEKDVLQQFGEGIKIKFHPAISQFSEISEISTHWIEDLKSKSEQEIWDSFRKTLRHEIIHAQSQKLIIRRCGDLKELKRFYNLYAANLKRKKTIPYPWRVVQFLCQNPSNELLLAFYGDKIIGGSLFVKYCGFVHYFLSASGHKYKNLRANYLILWTEIKSLVGQDIVLDLGATPKNSSLYTFKSGWGGREYPIIIFEKEKNGKSFRSSKLRNLFTLLPNFVVRMASSALIKYRL